jgi:hypothetical protein
MRLSEIMINWKPEGMKKRGRPRRTWKHGIYTEVSEWANGTIEDNGIWKSELTCHNTLTGVVYVIQLSSNDGVVWVTTFISVMSAVQDKAKADTM